MQKNKAFRHHSGVKNVEFLFIDYSIFALKPNIGSDP